MENARLLRQIEEITAEFKILEKKHATVDETRAKLVQSQAQLKQDLEDQMCQNKQLKGESQRSALEKEQLVQKNEELDKEVEQLQLAL